MAGDKRQNNAGLADEDEAYNKVFGGEMGALNIDSIIQNSSSKKDADGDVQHLPDAIDFEDEDELASEDDLPEEIVDTNNENENIDDDDDDYMSMMADAHTSNTDGSPKSTNNNLFDMNEEILETHQQQQTDLMVSVNGVELEPLGSSDTQQDTLKHNKTPEFSNDYQSNGLAKKQITVQETEGEKLQRLQEEERKLIRAYFPSLKRGKVLKMTKLLPPKPQQYHWQVPSRPLKQLLPRVQFTIEVDTMDSFNSVTNTIKKNDHIIRITDTDYNILHNSQNEKGAELGEESLTNNNDTDDADEKGVFDSNLISEEWNIEHIIDGNLTKRKNIIENVTTDLDQDPVDWEWKEDDLIEGNLKNFEKPILNLNDHELLIVEDYKSRPSNSVSRIFERGQKDKIAKSVKITENMLKSRFNLSNDSNYDILKQNYVTKIRSTISNLNINHSLPAIKLQSPFYKVTLGQEQLRRFHRYPSFSHNIRTDASINFRRLKLRKRKTDRGKEVQEIFKKSTDLTLGDTAPMFLMEHSERQPMAFSKFGMTSKLINYYRKSNDNDPTRPKLLSGETHVLGVQDKSPFWNFGFVENGETVQTLYNNMIRAPIYRHEPNGSDFLLIKSTGAGQGHRFYLRNINNLFTVGQTLPCLEITGPTSRKVHLMGKNRLKMIAYRRLNKSSNSSLTIRDIKHHFPGQSDMHIRLKLKEFMKFHREKEKDKDDNGSWKLKEGELKLDFETIRKLITPEDVSMQDSTYSAQAFLDDNKIYNMNEEKANLEEQLAPWNTTKNFLNATQMRAMVAIHGEGDPTGRGDGISFLKTSMKGGFSVNQHLGTAGNGPGTPGTPSAVSHGYSVSQQQKIYEDEIKKTWYAQAKSLRVRNVFTELNEDPNQPNESNQSIKGVRSGDAKFLKIIRKRRDQFGIIHRETVILKDPRVIHGYLKHYEMSEKNLDTDILLSDNAKSFILGATDEEKTKKLQDLLTSRLSEAAKKNAPGGTVSSPVPGLGPGSVFGFGSAGAASGGPGSAGGSGNTPVKKLGGATKTTRKCTACGEVGHIKTSRSCPAYIAQK